MYLLWIAFVADMQPLFYQRRFLYINLYILNTKEIKMIANIKILEKYCKDYKNIENYEDAVRSPLIYDLHHRREISESKSKKQLIEENLYYERPPQELIFLEHGAHTILHKEGVNHKGEKNPMFGKQCSAETRKKISEAGKGMLKGKHWHLEDGHRIWTD